MRVWNFTDGCNTSANFTQTITVVDTTAPVLSLPANVSAECSDDLTPIAFGSATATDNCDANPVITFEDTIEDGACSGTYKIIKHGQQRMLVVILQLLIKQYRRQI